MSARRVAIALGVLAALLLVVVVGLIVAAIWTGGATGDRLADTAAVAFCALMLVGVGAGVAGSEAA